MSNFDLRLRPDRFPNKYDFGVWKEETQNTEMLKEQESTSYERKRERERKKMKTIARQTKRKMNETPNSNSVEVIWKLHVGQKSLFCCCWLYFSFSLFIFDFLCFLCVMRIIIKLLSLFVEQIHHKEREGKVTFHFNGYISFGWNHLRSTYTRYHY